MTNEASYSSTLTPRVFKLNGGEPPTTQPYTPWAAMQEHTGAHNCSSTLQSTGSPSQERTTATGSPAPDEQLAVHPRLPCHRHPFIGPNIGIGIP